MGNAIARLDHARPASSTSLQRTAGKLCVLPRRLLNSSVRRPGDPIVVIQMEHVHEKVLVSSLLFYVIGKASATIDSFSNWLLVGFAAAITFLLGNLKALSSVGSSEMRAQTDIELDPDAWKLTRGSSMALGLDNAS